MKRIAQALCITLSISYCAINFGMMRFATKARLPRSTGARPLSTQNIQQQKNITQPATIINPAVLVAGSKTSPSLIAKLKTIGWNTWTSLSNMFSLSSAPVTSTPQSVPINTVAPIAEQLPIASSPVEKPQETMLIKLQTAQSLPEMEQILKNNETQEHNKQQALLNISNEQWLAMLKKEEEHFAWINNCFKNKNIATDDRDKIPQNIYTGL